MLKKKQKKYALSLQILLVFSLFLLRSSYVFAQNDPLAGKDSLVLERERIEDLPPIVKPLPPFPVPEAPTQKNVLQYQSPEIDYLPEIKPFVIRPLGVPKPKWKALYPNSLLLAGGRFLTLYSELNLANGRNTKQNYGLHYTQRSTSKGHTDFARFGIHKINAFYENYKGEHTLGANAKFVYQKHFYFGSPYLDSLSEKGIKDSLKIRWLKPELNLYIRKKEQYEVPFNVKFYSDNLGNKETFLALSPKIHYDFSSDLQGETRSFLEYAIYNYGKNSFTGYNLNLWQTVSKEVIENLKLEGGLNFSYASLGDSARLNIYPILKADYLMEKHRLFFELFGKQELAKRYAFSTENYYLDSLVSTNIQGNSWNTTIGIKGNFASTDYFFKINASNYKNLPVFTADSLSRKFYVNYLTGNTLFTVFSVGADKNIKEIVRFGFQADYRIFDKEKPVYGIPNVEARIYFNYKIKEKLSVKTSIEYIGTRKLAKDFLAKEVLFPKFSTFYHFSERISIFAEVNNILGQTYYRWYSYRERPLDFLIGAVISI